MLKRWRRNRRIIQAAEKLAATTFAQDFRDRIESLNELCESVE